MAMVTAMRARRHHGRSPVTSLCDAYGFFAEPLQRRWSVVALATGEERGGFELEGALVGTVAMGGDRHGVLYRRDRMGPLRCRIIALPEGETLVEHEVPPWCWEVRLLGASADGTRAVVQATHRDSECELVLLDVPTGEVLRRENAVPLRQPEFEDVLGHLDGEARVLTLREATGELVDLDFVTGELRRSGVRFARPIIALTGLGPALLGACGVSEASSLLIDRASKRLRAASADMAPQEGARHRPPRYSAATDRVLIALEIPTRRSKAELEIQTYDGAGALLDRHTVKRTGVRAWQADWSRDGSLLLLEGSPRRMARGAVEPGTPGARLSLFERSGGAERLVGTIDDLDEGGDALGPLRKSTRGTWLFVDAPSFAHFDTERVTYWVRDPTA